MSLDLVVLHDPVTIERGVSIGVDAHYRLFTLFAGAGFELLMRFSDYYEDGEIFFQEMPALKNELGNASLLVRKDPELAGIVADLIALSEFAAEKKKSIVAMPD